MTVRNVLCCLLVVSASLLLGLSAANATPLAPVASWSYDTDFTASHGGSTYDATPYAGASISSAESKWGGGSAKFVKASNQWAQSASPFTQGDYTYSAWYWLDVDWCTDRYFILESTNVAEDACPASVGARDKSGYDQLQAYIHTVDHDGVCAYGITDPNRAWHNVIVTADVEGAPGSETTTLSIYVDGVCTTDLSDPGTISSDGIVRATDYLNIGTYRHADDRFWNGYLDDIAVWNHVLSSDDIAYLQTHSAADLVPEPGTLCLLGIGLFSLLAYIWRKQ